MNLTDILNKIIQRGQNRVATKGLHKHRIIPGYQGGSYKRDNITYLTLKEHRIVHWIRYKLHGHKEDLSAAIVLGQRLSTEQYLSWCASRSRAFMQEEAYKKARSNQMKKLWQSNEGQERKARHRDTIKKATSKKVAVDDLVFESLTDCATHYKISVEAVRKRIRSQNFSTWLQLP